MVAVFRRFWTCVLFVAYITLLCACNITPTDISYRDDSITDDCSKLSPENLVQYIGADRMEVLTGLSLSEIKDEFPFRGVDVLPTVYPIEGHNYEVELTFDLNDRKLLGYRYVRTGNADALLIDLSALMEQTQAQYGEPSTYPGLDTRFLGEEDGCKVFAKKGVVSETWNLSKLREFSKALEVTDIPCMFVKEIKLEKMEETSVLSLHYHLIADRNAK